MKTSENIATSIRKIRKRKFSEEQIRSLEFLFESEARPEAQLKQKVASELGLHPRQVAIWFQNKRARSKSKQIEQDYAVLKASYDNLALQFESLEKENQNLAIQVMHLPLYLSKTTGLAPVQRLMNVLGIFLTVAETERWAGETSWEGRWGIGDRVH